MYALRKALFSNMILYLTMSKFWEVRLAFITEPGAEVLKFGERTSNGLRIASEFESCP